ncbi:MAG: hypothetical protein QOH75_2875 [Actinomycetota bacterium]|nr:hypothetical protein [Actinomycetota bacterium]
MTEQPSFSPPGTRRRGVGFPVLSLRDAIEAIVTIGRNGATHSHDAAAAYLGHSTSNSGAFRSKLAALRDWGLIERGDKDRVTLSALAQQLVLEAPDHSLAGELLLSAFESCRVFGMVYNDSAKDTPLEMQRIRTSVVMRHGVASDQADKFVDSFIDSVTYAGLGKFDGNKLTLLPRDSLFQRAAGLPETDEPQTIGASPDRARGATTVNAAQVVAEPGIPIALRQAWPIDGGEIEFIIRTAEALPPSIWEQVAKMAKVAEEMQAKLAGPYVELRPDAKPPAAYGISQPAPEPTND